MCRTGRACATVVSSDALLLIVDDAPESHAIVPGKLFEYLGAGKPILAIAPHGSAVERLLHQTGCGEVAERTELERCAEILHRYIRAWRGEKVPLPQPRPEVIRQYERRTAAQRLAQLLDQLSALQPRQKDHYPQHHRAE
jgi:hypothetical protein